MKNTMKSMIMSFVLVIAVSVSGFSTGSEPNNVTARAEQVNFEMAKKLQLNNYQQAKLKEINTDVLMLIAQAEQKYQGNEAALDRECRSICAQRDEKLEALLSTDQYRHYFHNREAFYKASTMPNMAMAKK